tara:strand:+ start:623 stop:880 length:258 start_codon:yes stop_codon:yes gene_type:complete
MARTKTETNRAIKSLKASELEEATRHLAIALIQNFEEKEFAQANMKDLNSLLSLLRSLQTDTKVEEGTMSRVDEWILHVKKDTDI